MGGDEKGKVRNILFDNVNLDLVKVTDFPGGVYDLRPRDGEGFIESKTYGFYVCDAEDVKIRDCSVILSGFPAANYGGFLKEDLLPL